MLGPGLLPGVVRPERVQQLLEPVGVPGFPVVGMEPLGQEAEDALDGVAVGPGRDLQDLVVVETGGVGQGFLPGVVRAIGNGRG